MAKRQQEYGGFSAMIADAVASSQAAYQLIAPGSESGPLREFDLPVAANLIEWIADPRFLGFNQLYDHWGQYQLLRDFCQLRCPICNEFDKDSEGPGRCWGKTRSQLEDEVLLVREGRSAKESCPKCRGTREEFVDDGLLYNYNTMLGAVGMRGGKSSSVGLFATYLEHFLYTFAGWERASLSKLFGQATGTNFDVAFVATTAQQTEQTIWDYFTSFREQSVWLQRYRAGIKEIEGAQSKLVKRWAFKELDKMIENELIGIKFQSLHSNSASMAGATRVVSFIDELARFDTSESKRSADEVWRVLSASLKTIRQAAEVRRYPAYLFGAKVATSSVISVDDKMMTMLHKAEENDMDRTMTIKLATWEFNPQLPKEAFKDEYAEDPIQAERDFGANPPLTETPLIEDVPRFSKSITHNLTPSALFQITYPKDALGREYIGIELEDAIVSPEMPRFICFDAGASFDAFAGAMAHPGWIEVAPEPGDPDQRPRKVLVTIYDWVIRILPTVKPRRTVWFDSVVQIVRDLKHNFRIVRVTFDRWQSISLIQDIRNIGIQADQDSVKVPDFIGFRSDCYQGKVKLLPPRGNELSFTETGQLTMTRSPDKMSAEAAGIYELVKLSRSEDLKKVFNPNKGKNRGYDSDDVAQVLVAAHRQVQQAMVDDPYARGIKDRLRREQFGGEMWGGGAAVPTMSHWNVIAPNETGAPKGRHPGSIDRYNEDQFGHGRQRGGIAVAHQRPGQAVAGVLRRHGIVK